MAKEGGPQPTPAPTGNIWDNPLAFSTPICKQENPPSFLPVAPEMTDFQFAQHIAESNRQMGFVDELSVEELLRWTAKLNQDFQDGLWEPYDKL